MVKTWIEIKDRKQKTCKEMESSLKKEGTLSLCLFFEPPREEDSFSITALTSNSDVKKQIFLLELVFSSIYSKVIICKIALPPTC